jgi:hypothetical protein
VLFISTQTVLRRYLMGLEMQHGPVLSYALEAVFLCHGRMEILQQVAQILALLARLLALSR